MEDLGDNSSQSGENVTKLQAEFPPGMAPKMLKLVKMLNELEQKLAPLISKQHHEVLNKMPAIERAKMGLMEVYTINTLFWSLMRTSGEAVDPTLKEDYKIEMGRLKETQARLSEIEARAHRQTVDIEAASRFIHRGLGISIRTDELEGEDSFVSSAKKLKGENYLKKIKDTHLGDAQEADTSTSERKVKKKKLKKKTSKTPQSISDSTPMEKSKIIKKEELGKGAKKNCSGSGNWVSTTNGHKNAGNQNPTMKTQKKKRKRNKQANTSKPEYLDTAGSGIKLEDHDLNNKSKDWFEQGWTQTS